MILGNLGKSDWMILGKSCDIVSQYKCGQIRKNYLASKHMAIMFLIRKQILPTANHV